MEEGMSSDFLMAIMRGRGPETKKIVVGMDAYMELCMNDVLYREGYNDKTSLFGIPLEVDLDEIAIRFK